MIVVDTSAIMAVLLGEPERETYLQLIAGYSSAHISAVSVHEAGMVMRARRGEAEVADLYDLLQSLKIDIEAFDATQARLAISAFGRFGKGIHPKARLNLGDCAAYALAIHLGLPLLFKGDDFSATDVAVAK